MEEKKIQGATVNDGKGLYDNDGLLETLIVDLNKLPKLLIDGQFIATCDLIAKMAQKVMNIRKGIKAEKDDYEWKIEDLKRLNNELAEQVYKVPVEKDGVDNGGN